MLPKKQLKPDPVNVIYQGHVLEILKQLQSESVDSVITSPPYWCLRDYDLPPQIWDDKPACKHQFDEEIISKSIDRKSLMEWETGGDPKKNRKKEPPSFGQFCIKCGAWKGHLGLEPNFTLYIKHLCDIFDEIKRILKPQGTCWINIGDAYAGSNGNNGHKTSTKNLNTFKVISSEISPPNSKVKGIRNKSLCLIPSRFSIEMIDRGWILRNRIIWHKTNKMPESVKDRFTVDYEEILFFTKNRKYYFEQIFEPLKQSTIERNKYPVRKKNKKTKYLNEYMPANKTHSFIEKNDNSKMGTKRGRNKRSVWSIANNRYSDAHFAVFPTKLIEIPIIAGCPPRGIVLDPFLGSGTTAEVAKKKNRQFIGIELNPDYIVMAENRISKISECLF